MRQLNEMKKSTSKHRHAWLEAVLFVVLLMGAFSVQEALATTQKKLIKQDFKIVKHKIEDFLRTQSAGYAGDVTVKAGAIDPNLKLAACLIPEVFLPPGSRAWGKTSVGVQCDAPVKWKIYVQATVSIKSQYLVASHPLSRGHTITKQDLSFAEGDVTQLPQGVLTDASHILGQTVRSSVRAGSVLRQNMIKQALAVQQGQMVLLTTAGTGFTINAEGKALKNANQGELVSVKVRSGQVVSGIARADGKVEVRF